MEEMNINGEGLELELSELSDSNENIGITALELTAEVAKICDDNNIEYFLSPQVVKRGIDGLDYEKYFTMPDIYMTVENVVRFIEVVEKDMPAGRALDYMGNNKDYVSFNVSYVNTDTTFIQLSRGKDFSKRGFKVTINLIRNDIPDRLPAFVETGRELNAYRPNRKKTWKNKAVKNTMSAAMLINGDKFGEKLFRYYVKSYLKNPDSERVFIKTFNNKRLYYDRSLFTEKTEVDVGGYKFCAPKDIETYLTGFYGPTAMTMPIAVFDRATSLISNRVPFEAYMKNLEAAGIPMDELFNLSKVKKYITNTQITSTVDRVYTLAQMSKERMDLYALLEKDIDRIRELYREKDFKALTEIFKPYDVRARYYIKKNLTLCTDEEQFEILCAIMENRGAHARVEKMREYLPNHHRKPLVARKTDHREDKQ